MHLLTAAEMRAVDRATIASGTPGETLMERAGRGVADALERRWGAVLAWRVLVLAGSGNNGGDGYVAARMWASHGARVTVAVCAPRERLEGDARTMLERLDPRLVRVEFTPDAAALERVAASHDAWDFAVDALLGTGAEGPPRGVIADACRVLHRLRARGARVLAVDMPTGVSSDDGSVASGAVQADVTVTFGSPRRGHWLYPGRAQRGTLEVVDIGLLAPERASLSPAVLATARELARALPQRDPRAHKGSAGRVLIAGGAPGMTGALVLAARAAARSGAGYVRVAVPESLQDVLAAHLVEPMVVGCGEGPRRALHVSALPAILEEAARAQAVAVGSGLSTQKGAAALARELATHLPCPMVLDADALTALSPAGDRLVPALKLAPAPRVLTPHLGEMSRLTGLRPAELESRRIDAAHGWAQRWGATLVLKGAPTVVATADGRVSVNPTGTSALATAGTGDVLTGALVALLAQGLAPYDAARIAVYVHGRAGELAEHTRGPHSVLASDVIDHLAAAFTELASAR